MSPSDEIKQEGFLLDSGETAKILCPFCEGGSTKEISLSVTRDSKHLVLYKCHRNKCGRSGSLHSFHSSQVTLGNKKASSFRPNLYSKMLMGLEVHDLEYLQAKYGLDVEDVMDVQWVLSPTEGGMLSLCMPVYSPTGALRGHVLRVQKENGSKEVRSYKLLDEPWMCWYNSTVGDIVVVEDQISCLRAAEFCASVALLGTGFNQDKFEEVLRVAGDKRKIWIALDRDALAEGFKLLKRYRIFCPNLHVLAIPKDIKDMTRKELISLGGPFS